VLTLVGMFAARAGASERLCDASFEDCRTPLIKRWPSNSPSAATRSRRRRRSSIACRGVG